MKLAEPILAVMLLSVAAPAQPAAITVQEGQTVAFEGTMQTRRIANSFYTVLLPASPVTGVLAPDDSQGPQRVAIRHIDVRMDGQYDALRALNGSRVTVIGTLIIDPAILMNDAMIEAKEIRVISGKSLFPLSPVAAQAVPVQVKSYVATATFNAKSGYFDYSSVPQLERATEFLSCNFSRAGDVLNCFCADGFSAQNNFPSSGVAELDKPPYFSQLSVPEYITHDMHWRVTCKRLP